MKPGWRSLMVRLVEARADNARALLCEREAVLLNLSLGEQRRLFHIRVVEALSSPQGLQQPP